MLVRDPAELAGLVAAVREQATAASPFLVLERSIDGTPYQVVAHALFASSPPHQLLGFMAFTVNMPWVHAQYFDPLVKQVEKIGGSLGGLSISVSDDEGRAVTSTPVEPDGAGDLHTRFPLLFIDQALVKSIAVAADARPRVDGARPLAAGSRAPGDAAGRAADVLPDLRSRPAPACWRSC